MPRISDHNRWNDLRFRKLSITAKLVYVYLWDRCDRAGFYLIADPDIDCVRLGINIEQFKSAIKELSQPQESPSGHKHRGFISHKGIVWISHFIKHDQFGKFCNASNRSHMGILSDLYSHWSAFADDPEYIEVLQSVPQDGWKFINAINPLIGHRVDSPDPTPRPSGLGAGILAEVPRLYEKVTGRKPIMDAYREKAIKEIINMGHDVKTFEKVFRMLFKKWSEKEADKRFITLKTFTNPETFNAYVEESENTEDQVVYKRRTRSNG